MKSSRIIWIAFHESAPNHPRWTLEDSNPARTARRMDIARQEGKSGFYARRFTAAEAKSLFGITA